MAKRARKYVTVQLELDLETVNILKKISKLAGVTMNTTLNVILAAKVLGYQQNETN